MPKEAIISLAVSGVLFVLVLGFLIFQIVWIKKMQKKYMYRWQSHEIVFEIAPRSVRLYVDGNIEDEFGAQRVRVSTLRAFVDGTQIKVRAEVRMFRMQIVATAGNTPLQLIGTGK